MRSLLLMLAVGCSSKVETPQRVPPEPVLPVSTVELQRTVPLLGGTLEDMPALGAVLSSLPEHGELALMLIPSAETVLTSFGKGSIPFRLAVEEEKAWVTLRGTGEVALVEPLEQRVVWRTSVCPEPRGITRVDGGVLVACAGGELVQLDDSGAIVRKEWIKPDLRDVLVVDGALFVSRFRSAEVLVLDPVTWQVLHRANFERAGVVWRMRPSPDEGVVMVFQSRPGKSLGAASPEYYSSFHCDGPSVATVGTVLSDGTMHLGSMIQSSQSQIPLPVDFLIGEGRELVIVDGAADWRSSEIYVLPFDEALSPEVCVGTAFAQARRMPDSVPSGVAMHDGALFLHGVQPDTLTSAAIGPTAPLNLNLYWQKGVAWSEPFHVFHENPAFTVSCASCHPEGTDDGRVWAFILNGRQEKRRTLTLAGGVSQRAPYHWFGEIADADALIEDTFVGKMGGDAMSPRQVEDLFAWLDGIHPVRATVLDTEAVSRGQTVFAEAGCAECHAGAQLTTNEIVEVHPLLPANKVPTLQGLGLQDYLMHDGCAHSIEERLVGPDWCTGGVQHGDIVGLTSEELADLAAFLRSL